MTDSVRRVYILVDLGDDVEQSTITDLAVHPGQIISARQDLFTVESAIGVITYFYSERPGIVTAVLKAVGQPLAVGEAVVEVAEEIA